MRAGLLVKNSLGTTQIDDTFSNIILKEKIIIPKSQWTVVNFPGGGSSSATTFTQPNEPRIFFLVKGSAAFKAVVRSSNSRTYTLIGSGDVELYAFGPSEASATKFGLQVYDENGILKFDANNKHFRFVSSQLTPNVGSSINFPNDGRRYAVALDSYETRWRSQLFSSLGYIGIQLRLITTVNSNGVLINEGITSYIPPSADPPVSDTNYPRLSRLTIIDVTNF